jgi:hypothetical protein
VAIETHGGIPFEHTGDGVCAAFSSAKSAVDAAVAAQRVLKLPVRMGLPVLDEAHQPIAISHRKCEIGMPEKAERIDTANGFNHGQAHAAIPVGCEGQSSVGERQVGGTGGLDEGVGAGDGHVGDVVQCSLDLPRAEPGSQPTGTHPNLTCRRSDTERQTRQLVRSGEAECESLVMHAAGLPPVRSIENRDAKTEHAVGMCESGHRRPPDAQVGAMRSNTSCYPFTTARRC